MTLDQISIEFGTLEAKVKGVCNLRPRKNDVESCGILLDSFGVNLLEIWKLHM